MVGCFECMYLRKYYTYQPELHAFRQITQEHFSANFIQFSDGHAGARSRTEME